MINFLSIKNFKGIKSLTLSNLAPITLLGGMNNVGKSSVLDAVFLLYTATLPDLFSRQYSLREMTNIDFNVERTWSNFFYNLDISQAIEIETISNNEHHHVICKVEQDYPLKSPILSNQEFTTGINQNTMSTSMLKAHFDIDGKEIHTVSIYKNNNEIVTSSESKSPSKPITVDVTFLRPARNRIIAPQWLSSLDIDNRLDSVVDVMKKIEPRIRGLSVVSSAHSNEIYIDFGLKRKIPLKLAGDGLSHVLSFILAIANTLDGIILIDEIENGLHYSVRTKIWENLMLFAKQFNCQIIATTHSYGMLQAAYDAFKETYSDDFRYIRLEKNLDIIKGISFSSKQLDTALKLDMEVR